jgi:hypothetical protein
MPAWEATTSPPSAEEARCGASPPRVAQHQKMRFAFAIPRKEKANPPLAPSEVEHVTLPLGSFICREVWERIPKQGKDVEVACVSPPAPGAVSDALP